MYVGISVTSSSVTERWKKLTVFCRPSTIRLRNGQAFVSNAEHGWLHRLSRRGAVFYNPGRNVQFRADPNAREKHLANRIVYIRRSLQVSTHTVRAEECTSDFRRSIWLILRRYRWLTWLIYTDDVIIYSLTTEKHLDYVEQFLEVLHQAFVALKREQKKGAPRAKRRTNGKFPSIDPESYFTYITRTPKNPAIFAGFERLKPLNWVGILRNRHWRQ